MVRFGSVRIFRVFRGSDGSIESSASRRVEKREGTIGDGTVWFWYGMVWYGMGWGFSSGLVPGGRSRMEPPSSALFKNGEPRRSLASDASRIRAAGLPLLAFFQQILYNFMPRNVCYLPTYLYVNVARFKGVM